MLRAKYTFTNDGLIGNGLTGQSSSKGVTMRIFCHEHKRGFFAPRQNPIKCENRGHLLGELDFAGQAKHSIHTLWQYCCNCEHFCVVNFEGDSLQRCPVCTRRSSSLYLCDRCYTISFESSTPLQTKNFTITAEGSPSPACPGCLNPATGDLREHFCDNAGLSFATALTVCPMCQERLDVSPSFPSLVSQYLKRTRAANKTFVTFDYDSSLFVPVDDGEFVVVQNNDEAGRTIALPRSPRLATVRDFYELYQDYYHCATPGEGLLSIVEPAVVVPVTHGWKLLAAGLLEVVAEPRKIAATPKPTTAPSVEEKQEVQSEPNHVSECPECGTMIEDKYAFCWGCGRPRVQQNVRMESAPVATMAIEDSDDDEQTVQHEGRSAPSTLFGWAANSKPEKSSTRSVLRLFSFAIGALLLLSLAAFAYWRTGSSPNQPAATQTAPPTEQPTSTPSVIANAEMKPATLQSTPSAEDTALTRLRQLRTSSRSSDHQKILKDLAESETKYANDYRFPYERARIVAIDQQKNFHEEAFAALSRAAQKAINQGKASEMLDDLDSDSRGDFQKLSHGHREWSQLRKALKSKNARGLSITEGL